MKTPAKCPGCGTKLEPEAEICPNCPMSFNGQDDEGPNPLKHESKYWAFVMPLAFFAILGLAVWKLGTGLLGIGLDQTQAERGSFSAGGGAPVTQEAVAKNIQASAQALVGEGAAPAVSTRAPDAAFASPAAAAAAVADAETQGHGVVSIVKETGASQARTAREWRLRGAVYDLVTLKPVAGAKLILLDNEANTRAETVTNAQGRYKTVVPALNKNGYLVSIAKAGYAASYAGPESAGAGELDPGSRLELARQLARTVEAPTSLEPGSDEPYITDFFLAPLNP